MSAFRRGVFASTAISAVLLLGAGQAEAETLADSVKTAITTNPRVQSAVQSRRSIDSEVRRARGLYLPQIDLRAGDGPEYSENSFTTGGQRRHFRQELSAIL